MKTSFKANSNKISFSDPIFSDPSWRQKTLMEENGPECITSDGACACHLGFGWGLGEDGGRSRPVLEDEKKERKERFPVLKNIILCSPIKEINLYLTGGHAETAYVG